VTFYRQSDVPETFELTTALMAFTPKGLMNRAHAYKAKVADNTEAGEDVDSGVNMGLYTYPVLMAADILLFDTELVPVGKDQVQHIEMAADIAEAVNRNYNQNLLVVPQASVGAETQTVVGLDGRKMSKSYNNSIPLFCEEKDLKKMIMKIVSDSTPVEEPKDPDSSHIFTLYKLFATAEQKEDFARRLRAGGMGWGAAKTELFELMNQHLSPIRERYRDTLADTAAVEKVLKAGGEKARAIASQTLGRVRKAIGIG
jgi:tryptophanyl-tRNA synthetase